MLLIGYIFAVVLPFAIGQNTDFWEHFYYIREHGFIIGILLLKDKSYSVFATLLMYGIIIYKLELILYNNVLLLIPENKAYTLNHSYDAMLIFTGSLFLIIFVCKFFDKICLILTRVTKWISK